MPVITISREFASVGDDFGETIARTLGYHCVCKEEIIALLDQYGMIEFSREYDSRPGFWENLSSQGAERRGAMVAMLNQVVQAVAHHGNVVIQGRSGFAALQGFADVLHVRLQSPVEARIANTMERQHLLREHAEAMVKVRDSVRKAFVERFYGVPWESMQAFDLVINTGKLSCDLAVTAVVNAAQELARTSPDNKPTTRSIRVDPVLAAAVSRQLDCTTLHG